MANVVQATTRRLSCGLVNDNGALRECERSVYSMCLTNPTLKEYYCKDRVGRSATAAVWTCLLTSCWGIWWFCHTTNREVVQTIAFLLSMYISYRLFLAGYRIYLLSPVALAALARRLESPRQYVAMYAVLVLSHSVSTPVSGINPMCLSVTDRRRLLRVWKRWAQRQNLVA